MIPAVKNALLPTACLSMACLLMAMAAGAAESVPAATVVSAVDAAVNTTGDKNAKTLVWPDGTRYVGAVSDGKRSGKGTIFWKDGTRFVGSFKDDLRNGPGTMILPDGTVYTGYFTNDLLVDKPTAATKNIADNDSSNANMPSRPTEMAAPVAEVSDQQLEAVQAATAAGLATATAVDTTAPLSEPITEISDPVKEDLQTSIDKWAMHWSQQDAPAYFDSYSEEFEVPSKMTRSQWKAQRKTRLERPEFIKVSVVYNDFNILAADEARVTFKQTYQSTRYNDVTRKFLRLKKQNDRWLISAEGNL